MALGSDDLRRFLKPRDLQRKRTVRLVACAFFAAVFLLFAGGTTYALTTSDYPWENGELAAEIITIVVSLGLAVFTGLRARGFGRQADALQARLSRHKMLWLPPAADSVHADVEAQTPRLRIYTCRAALICVAWVAALLLGASGFVLMNETGQRLLDQGDQTAGIVASVHNARRGMSTITVQFLQRGIVRTAKVNRDSDRDYAPGQGVTVVYDPADPERVRTLDERNDNEFVTGGAYFLVLVACVMIPLSAVAARGWQRRHRAVRTSGWRAGTAHVTHAPSQRATFAVKYRDGSRITLKAATSTHTPPAFGQFRGVPVWVGGAGRNMVVLLRRGRIRKALHAVPVRAAAPRV
jgi:hypothetical protein